MGGEVGLCIGVHIVTVIVVVIQVTMTMVIIRGPQEVRVEVVMMMRGECEYTGGEKWGHLPHEHHTAHVPLTDVLVENRRLIEHVPVRRHAAE